MGAVVDSRPFTEEEWAGFSASFGTIQDPHLLRMVATAAAYFSLRNRCIDIAREAAGRYTALGQPVAAKAALEIARDIRGMDSGLSVRMTPVVSSNVASLGWDGVDLYVEYRSGAVWRYEGVPGPVWKALTNSKSIGRYLAAAIKPFHRGAQIPQPTSPSAPTPDAQ